MNNDSNESVNCVQKPMSSDLCADTYIINLCAMANVFINKTCNVPIT